PTWTGGRLSAPPRTSLQSDGGFVLAPVAPRTGAAPNPGLSSRVGDSPKPPNAVIAQPFLAQTNRRSGSVSPSLHVLDLRLSPPIRGVLDLRPTPVAGTVDAAAIRRSTHSGGPPRAARSAV